MMNALYTGAAGLLTQHQVLETVAGNLANQNSLGYLAQHSQVVGLLPETVMGQGPSGMVPIGQVITEQAVLSGVNLTPGQVRTTGHYTDLAIMGQGFFVVKTPKGLAYTQDGRFSVNAQGQLVTATGDFVLSSSGQPIDVGLAPFHVSPGGQITQNGQVVATLGLVDLPNQGIQALGNSLYQAPRRLPFTGQVMQGAVNTSNGNMTQETMTMMEAEQTYQSLTTLINEESSRLKTAASLSIIA
ncbi:flagellar hook-basal body protein [Sulfobacillus thermosulfidooxidans]|uniref:flagellar hook-basal body protein n=1 Tax=Sulfobacillus thermosulfidooxidans TaxID=28034 RepID=UPI0002FEA9D3|nr:flagellar hook basal-body protein [Sulfobacillus thermosulfidooxidans]